MSHAYHRARNHWARLRSGERLCSTARLVVREVGPDRVVSRIRRREIEALTRRWSAEGLSPATVNRRLSALSRLLKEGGRELTMPWLCERGRREAILSREDEQRLLDALPSQSREHATLLLYTGCHDSELRRMEWGDVDWSAGVLRIRDSKTAARSRSLPILEPVRPILKSRRAAPRPVIDPEYRLFYSEWRKARKVLDLDALVPYSLRHTCASRLIEGGTPLPIVQRWLGHANIQTTMRYLHVSDRAVLDAGRTLL